MSAEFTFDTYPRTNKVRVTLSSDVIRVAERAMSGITWLIHLHGWAAPVVVYDTAKLGLEAFLRESEHMIELSPDRFLDARAVGACFFRDRKKDVVRIQVEGVRANFDVVGNEETPLRDQVEEIRLMIQNGGGPRIATFEELQAAA